MAEYFVFEGLWILVLRLKIVLNGWKAIEGWGQYQEQDSAFFPFTIKTPITSYHTTIANYLRKDSHYFKYMFSLTLNKPWSILMLVSLILLSSLPSASAQAIELPIEDLLSRSRGKVPWWLILSMILFILLIVYWKW